MPMLRTLIQPFSYITTKIKNLKNAPVAEKTEQSPIEQALGMLGRTITFANDELNRIMTQTDINRVAELTALHQQITTRCTAALHLPGVNKNDSKIQAAVANIVNTLKQINQLKKHNDDVEIIQESEGTVLAKNTDAIPPQPQPTTDDDSDSDSDSDTNDSDTNDSDDVDDFDSSLTLKFNMQLIANILEVLLVLSLIGAALFSGIIFTPEVVAVGAGVAALATADVIISAVSASYRFFTRPTDAPQDPNASAAQPQA